MTVTFTPCFTHRRQCSYERLADAFCSGTKLSVRNKTSICSLSHKLERGGSSRPGRQSEPAAQIRQIDLTTDHRAPQKRTQGCRFPVCLQIEITRTTSRD